MINWKITEVSRNVHTLRLLPAKEWWGLLVTDCHFDNANCRLDLLKKHFDQAKERGAFVISAGDFFCAMQGKFDKRSNKTSLRPEFQRDDYIDALVDEATKWLTPYAANLAVWGDGNHESSIAKLHETRLSERLCARLRDRGSNVKHGGYSGWVRHYLESKGRKCPRGSVDLFYHHGGGQDPAVTKGLIEHERMASWLKAEVVLTGHIHQQNYTRTRSIELNLNCNIVHCYTHWLRAGTYQESYQDGFGGYHIEKNRGPRPLGGWWVRFYIKNHEVKFDIMPTEI